MIDEVEIYSKLESALFGSLIHATGVSAAVVHADASAIRLFNGPSRVLSTYIHTGRTGLDDATTQALKNWPTDDDSIFEFARKKKLFDHAFQPQEMIDHEIADANGRFFGPFQSMGGLTDVFCLTFPVFDPAWCMIAYLRWAPSPVFDQDELEQLRRFKPALARVTRMGYHREMHGHTTTVTTASSADLMAKLSRTERLVLSFLRSEATEKQIAQTIHRSPHTIHVHVKNIYRKLGVNSRRMLTTLFDGSRTDRYVASVPQGS